MNERDIAIIDKTMKNRLINICKNQKEGFASSVFNYEDDKNKEKMEYCMDCKTLEFIPCMKMYSEDFRNNYPYKKNDYINDVDFERKRKSRKSKSRKSKSKLRKSKSTSRKLRKLRNKKKNRL